jgi:hypothetical protein
LLRFEGLARGSDASGQFFVVAPLHQQGRTVRPSDACAFPFARRCRTLRQLQARLIRWQALVGVPFPARNCGMVAGR